MADEIGPAMPPGFRSSSTSDSDEDYGPSKESISKSDETKRSSSSHRKSTSSSRRDTSDSSSDSSDSEDDERTKSAKAEVTKSSSEFIGPVIPSGFAMRRDSSSSEDGHKDEEAESDEDVIGPMPNTSGSYRAPSAAEEFEKRAEKMKKKLLQGDDEEKQPEREEWMTALPDVKMVTGLGLSNRSFRTDQFAREGRGDTSAWTDTPADRERKRKEAEEGGGESSKKQKREHVFLSERDKLMQEQISEHNKNKRTESLLEMHQKKLHKKDKKKKKEKDKKKKKKKEKEKEKKKKKEKKPEKKPERRPFDRDVDLKANRFDDAMRKSYIKKAQGLGGNFGHSSQGKFL